MLVSGRWRAMTTRSRELDGVAGELDAAKREVLSVLVKCSVYVDRLAAAGDPEALVLAALIRSAFDRQECAAVAATTVIVEAKR
jgi:hypothetical protein